MPVVNTTQSGETNTTWDISTIDDMKTSSIDDPQCNTQEQPKTVVTTETEETGSKEPFTFVDEKLPNHNGASYNGRNGEMYGAIEYSFSLSFLTLEQYNFYFEIFRGTNVSCYGHFCEYFNISKEEYMAFWDDFKARWNAYNVRKQEDIDNRHNFEYVFDVERD
ncbi:hypothetical protein SDC9_98188 [bioreactor metagenome]|uniref:Uncharacterized protein n=1 Tax=bioreactor metagenome TaxID=1076179 RepID=A0A645AE32_9ZZZZ